MRLLSVAAQGVGDRPASLAAQGLVAGVFPEPPFRGQDPTAISVQGVGFSPRLLARHGFNPLHGIPIGGGPRVTKRPKAKRDRDDDVLMFLLR